MRTRSTGCCWRTVSAASPLSATPTTRNPTVSSTTWVATRRKAAKSSTTRTPTSGWITPQASCPAARMSVVVALPRFGTVAQHHQNRFDPPIHITIVSKIELGEDRVHMLLDGTVRNVEPGRDRGVRLPLRDLRKGFLLPGREPAQRRPGTALLSGHQGLHHQRVNERPSTR